MEKKRQKEIIRAQKSLWDEKNLNKILKTGRYDVWFTMINDIPRSEVYWIRYTIMCPKSDKKYDGTIPIEQFIDALDGARASLWFGYFNSNNSEKNFMARKVFPLSKAKGSREIPDDKYCVFKIEENEIFLDGMHGSFEISTKSLRRKISWDLKFDHFMDPFFPIPGIAKILRITTTLLNISHPNLRISGTITIDDETKTLESVPGEQTHTYGLEYADKKIWLHCNAFKEDPEAWLEFGYKMGKGTLGFYDGSRLYGLNKISTMKKFNIVDYDVDKLKFNFSDKSIKIDCEVNVDRDMLLGVVYKGPNGTTGYCYNSETADIKFHIVILNKDRTILSDKTYTCDKNLAWETHWLNPIEGLKLLDWADEII